MMDSPSGSSEVNPEVEIDLDEVLDLDGDAERRKFIRSLLTNAKKSQDVIEKFIDDLLEKAKIL
ncbi:Protein phosphatase 1 regulatory subunit 14B [Orchesella cincta]|uniref:Protein phosphatase 1 regulatory subunit 14B n=1 Tax=Orchesella cincta TaxID=48709 RepID=A0A1D2NGJ1_ORCCI|nr:Protein phosphatase 1 regulatory subunit 14B [Orchesella cincta]